MMNKHEVAAIRSPQPADVERIAELSMQLGYPTTAIRIRERLSSVRRSKNHIFLVAEARGGGIVGWIHAYVRLNMISDRLAEVDGLVVDERFRRRGIGRLLMSGVEQWAVGMHCEAVNVRSNVIREDAHRFYNRLGYNSIKTQAVFRKELDRG